MSKLSSCLTQIFLLWRAFSRLETRVRETHEVMIHATMIPQGADKAVNTRQAQCVSFCARMHGSARHWKNSAEPGRCQCRTNGVHAKLEPPSGACPLFKFGPFGVFAPSRQEMRTRSSTSAHPTASPAPRSSCLVSVRRTCNRWNGRAIQKRRRRVEWKGKKRGEREEGTCFSTRLACCIDERRDKHGRRSTQERHKNSSCRVKSSANRSVFQSKARKRR